MQIVIVLLDDHMVADPTWRYWLGSLKQQGATPARVFLPVALDSTSFNAPPPLASLNYLRPAGLPLPEGTDREERRSAFERVVRSLLKQLTEALCRLLLSPIENQDGGPVVEDSSQRKVAIFLSHAKVDGSGPARRIRDYIYSQTQIAAFYDENDIPFGSAFGQVLQTSLQAAQTASLIAVQSARYASRPWCRREVSMFRRPLRQRAEGLSEQWRLHPVVVVNAIEAGGLTTNIPELGNAPQIRWSEQACDQEEQIVTLVLRDTLLAAFHARVGRSISDANPDSIVINWLPDPTTLLHIPRVREAQKASRIFYPGRGLSGLELDILDEYFPRLSFHSFDQAGT